MKKIVKIMLFCLLGIFAVSCGKNSSSDTAVSGEKKSGESPSKKISIVLD